MTAGSGWPASNWLRPDAETSRKRLFCHVYARGKGNAQMILGWPYSWVVALEPGRTSWDAEPLDAVRLGPADDATEVTAAQVRDVTGRLIAAGHWREGDPDIIVVLDSGYDLTRLAWLLVGLPVDVRRRLRSDRVMYLAAPPRPPHSLPDVFTDRIGGRPTGRAGGSPDRFYPIPRTVADIIEQAARHARTGLRRSPGWLASANSRKRRPQLSRRDSRSVSRLVSKGHALVGARMSRHPRGCLAAELVVDPIGALRPQRQPRVWSGQQGRCGRGQSRRWR